MIIQAIETKYAGPTNTRGSRIVVTAAAGRKSFGYDHALDATENHRVAARKYAEALGWLSEGRTLVTGGTKHGYTHVLVNR